MNFIEFENIRKLCRMMNPLYSLLIPTLALQSISLPSVLIFKRSTTDQQLCLNSCGTTTQGLRSTSSRSQADPVILHTPNSPPSPAIAMSEKRSQMLWKIVSSIFFLTLGYVGSFKVYPHGDFLNCRLLSLHREVQEPLRPAAFC